MSMNVCCFLVLPGHPDEEIPLMQTPTMDTDMILEKLVAVKTSKKTKNKTRHERVAYPWQEQARRYLAWVYQRMDDHYGLRSRDPDTIEQARWIIKRERRTIGQAWRRAEESGGHLRFGRS
jgi:hypothetical protein